MDDGDSVRNNFNPDMKQFEQLFKKSFPGLQSIDMQDWNNINSIENYVQKMLNNSLKQVRMGNSSVTDFTSEVFETHDRVIAKINIPNHINPDRIKLYVNGSQIKLENRNESQYIKLPAFVNSSTAKALFKNGILQVQMRKQSTYDDYREVFIRSN